MPKSRKQNNDLRGIRKETVIAVFAAGAVFLALFAVIMARLGTHPLRWGAACLAGFVVVSAAAYLLFERRRLRVRDEKLAPVMGRIMFDAVVKMSTPVIICDSAERILWYNNATESLYSSGNRLYGETVTDLFGVSVADIRTGGGEDGLRVTCEGRTFLAKYNHIRSEDDDFALILTTEVTEQDGLRRRIEEEEPAVCYIIIDNLGEMMQYDSEQYRPAAARIDETLRIWADNYNGILKEYERDKYLFLTQARVIGELVASRFSILDRVRAVKVGDTSVPLTISIGVSAVHGSFEDKERAAHAALELALQRGGDQAVVKSDDATEFYGGVTRSVQKRSNVQARVVSNELMTLIKSASNVIIMGHSRADYDAFGACAGLAKIAMYCGTRVNIAVDLANRDIMGSRRMLEGEEEFLGIVVDPVSALDLLEVGTLVIMADVSNMNNVESRELAQRTEKLAVIDHHRKTAEFDRPVDVEYIDPSASSACELISEMMEQVLPRDDLSAAEANVILAGIMLDTKQFSKNTGTRTFSAAMYLRERGADPAAVRGLFRDSFEDYVGEAKFRSNVEIYRGCCAISVAEAGADANPVIAAKAADNLIMVDGMRAAFTIMEMGDSVKISARSGGDLNVQLIMEALGGGGHFDGAAAVSRGKTVDELIRDLKAAIDRY
ncbi:MAG: DHH family phosphoesterase, partial [Clostridia bacterium]|nr:DHH family phosphoesterase [Clostridia bacterium]